jgi:hypothetical protein
MGAPRLQPRPLYRPRDHTASPLWQLLDRHFDEFERVYDDRLAAKYGFWRPQIRKSVDAYLKCGDLHEGFARVRCPQCKHEMFVAYSCKQRCACPSCHQKRALVTAMHVEEDVCASVPHRQLVFTIPKRFRLYCRYDRKLLGRMTREAWLCVRQYVHEALGRKDAVPGMIAAMQTHGELLHFHPHLHALVTCGAFTDDGTFLDVPAFDEDRMLALWEDRIFKLLTKEDLVTEDVVGQMRSWDHTGFGFDQSVHLPAGDRKGIERLIQYMVRCPFSLSRILKVTDEGTVVYKSEKQQCRPFPDVKSPSLKQGTSRNFQILPVLDFLAEFTQHIPAKGSHLIRYYGWYSNKARGMRKKAVASDEPAPAEGDTEFRKACRQRWAMLIQRIYEVDPMACPQCSTQMKVVAFIDPPQEEIIQKILKHCGLWEEPPERAPPGLDGFTQDPDEAVEVEYVDIDTFLAEF